MAENSSDETVRSLILELEQARTDAVLRGDVQALDRLTSTDYLHVESSGKVRNKAEFLAALPAVRFEVFVIDDNEVRVLGDVAVAAGRYHNVIRTADGVLPVKHARHVRVWVREGARWLNAVHQATEVKS